MGGSIGISAVNALVARHEQIRQNDVVAHLTRGSAPFTNLLAQTQALMSLHADPGLASRRALALVEQVVRRQVAALSYVDVFRILAFLSFACVPVVFMARSVKGRSHAAAH